MAGDDGFREAGVQLFQQQTHRNLLSLRAGVRRTAVDVQPTLIADADRVLVVVQAVGTHHFFIYVVLGNQGYRYSKCNPPYERKALLG